MKDYPRFTDDFEKAVRKHFSFIYGDDTVDECLRETHKLLENMIYTRLKSR